MSEAPLTIVFTTVRAIFSLSLRTLIIGLFALGCSARGVGSTDAAGGSSRITSDAAAELVGTWRLVEFWDRDSAAAPRRYAYGEQPTGYFVYDATGHVSVQIQRGPAATVIANERGEDWFQKASPEELRVTVESFRAYFGTYSVDREQGIVIHRVEGDSRALYTGTMQHRRFRLVGDSLIIGNDTTTRRVLIRLR